MVSLACHRSELALDITSLDSPGDGIGVHRRSRGLFPVSIDPGLVNDVVPEARFRILVFRITLNKLTNQRNQLWARRMSLRRCLEHIDERHSIPANRTRPEKRGGVCVWLRPRLFARFVIGVKKQAGLWIVQVLSVDKKFLPPLVVGGVRI